jgi:hypothetical protein
MLLRTEQLSSSTAAQQIIRIYETNPATSEDEFVCDVVLDEGKPPRLDLSVSVWPWESHETKKEVEIGRAAY